MVDRFDLIEKKVKSEIISKKVNFLHKLYAYFTDNKKFLGMTKDEEYVSHAYFFVMPFAGLFSILYISFQLIPSTYTRSLDWILLPIPALFLFILTMSFWFAYVLIASYSLNFIFSQLDYKVKFTQTAKGFIYGLPPFMILSTSFVYFSGNLLLRLLFPILGLMLTILIQKRGILAYNDLPLNNKILPYIFLADSIILGFFLAY